METLLTMDPVTGYKIFVGLLVGAAIWLLPQIKAHTRKVQAENKLNAN